MHRLISAAVLAIFLPSNAIFAAARTDPSSPPEDQVGGFTGGLSTSLFIFIFALATALIFMGLVSVYIICNHHCGTLAGTSSYPPLRVLQPLPASLARGIDASVVETFPAFVYAEVKSTKIGKGALECAVCLNEFEDHETLRLLPKCDHVFHTRCIGAWLGAHTTCPVCRSDLAAEPVVQRIIQTEASGVETQTEGERHEPAVHIEPTQDNRDYTRGPVLAATSVRLLRWNSTGHSLGRSGENTDRFTLKLSKDVRKHMTMTLSQSVAVAESSRLENTLNRWQTMSDRCLILKTYSFRWKNGSSKSLREVTISKEMSVQSVRAEESKCDLVHQPV